MKLITPITVFILASASVHAVLVISSNSTTAITLPGTTGSMMNVKIQEESKTSPKKVNDNATPPEIQTQLTKTNPATKKPAQKEIKSKISLSPIKNQQAESKARVISVIYQELNQHFTYPKLAQKRNWQGKVLLSLQVSTNGKINNVQIHKSSGYSVLDQAAIDSLIKVGYLPQISSWLPYDINLKLPVIYQLTEG